jgi:hypothetical protein
LSPRGMSVLLKSAEEPRLVARGSGFRIVAGH